MVHLLCEYGYYYSELLWAQFVNIIMEYFIIGAGLVPRVELGQVNIILIKGTVRPDETGVECDINQ
jgi:hypothetical protein